MKRRKKIYLYMTAALILLYFGLVYELVTEEEFEGNWKSKKNLIVMKIYFFLLLYQYIKLKST